jgi:hypothetical protein
MPAIVAIVIQALLQYGPAAALAIKNILSKPEPTQADWDAVFAAATQKSYDDYIAAAKAKAGVA